MTAQLETQEVNVRRKYANELMLFDDVRNGIELFKKENAELVFCYDDPKGEKEARSHIYKLRQVKSNLANIKKQAKAEVLAASRAIDSEYNLLNSDVEDMIKVHKDPIDIIDAKRKVEEAERIEAKRIEKERIEKERMDAIQTREDEAERKLAELRLREDALRQNKEELAAQLKAREESLMRAERERQANIAAEETALRAKLQAEDDARKAELQAKEEAYEAKVKADKAAQLAKIKAENDKLEAERKALDAEKRRAEQVELDRLAHIQKKEDEKKAAIEAEQDKKDAEAKAEAARVADEEHREVVRCDIRSDIENILGKDKDVMDPQKTALTLTDSLVVDEIRHITINY